MPIVSWRCNTIYAGAKVHRYLSLFLPAKEYTPDSECGEGRGDNCPMKIPDQLIKREA